MPDSGPSLLRRVVVPVLLVLLAGVALFARAMDRDLNHDEHQFLAAGTLLAHQGAEPYKDFPLFHVPNLVFVYAGLAKLTDHYLLAAKCLSVAATLIVVAGLIFRTARRPAFGSWAWSLPVATAVGVLLLFDPLFLWTTGKTWNHEVPVALVYLAFLCHVAAARTGSVLKVIASGVLVSLAIGSRLTLLPVVLPFGLAIGFFPSVPARRRVVLGAAFAAAAVFAMAPSLYYFLTARDAFLFGNFEFPRVRLLDPTDTRAADTATWWRKLRYFFKEIVMLDHEKSGEIKGSLLLFGALVVIAIRPALAWWPSQWTRSREVASEVLPGEGFPLALALAILPFTGLGCGLPTRYQYQHWFAIIPFVAVAVTEAAALHRHPGRRSWRPVAVLVAAIFAVCLSGHAYVTAVAQLTQPAAWFPMRMHQYAGDIKSYIPEGKVLTLGPAWPVEVGIPVYPEFATGPFAWRLGHLLDRDRRERFRIVAPDDLVQFLAADPPAGILTKVDEDNLEEPFIAYAKANGYTRIHLRKRRDLWLPPKPPTAAEP